MDNNEEILPIVKQGLEIRRQQPNRLDRAGTLIVKAGMRRLKELGLTNKEIYEAFGGAWSLPAIKEMTAGVGAIDPEARKSFGSVVHDYAMSGLTAADLKRLQPIARSSIDPKLAMEFLEDTMLSGKDPGETLLLYKKMKDKGISPDIAAKVNATTEVMTRCRYTNGTLEKFREVSADYSPDELLQSVSIHRGMDNMKIAEGKQIQRQAEIDRQLAVKMAELKKVEEKKNMLEAPIKKVELLHSVGWNDDLLDTTFKVTMKFGKPTDVLEGVYAYGSKTKLEETISGLERKITDKESTLKKAHADNAHFDASLGMATGLVDLGLTLPAIAKFVEMARKLGLPESVFTAIISYGSVENLEKRKGILESLIGELEKKYGALEVLVDKASKEHIEIQKMIETHLDVIRLAKVILAVSFSPKPNVEFGLKYAKPCLSACRNICRGIEVKKTVKARDVFENKYPRYAFAEFEVQDLLDMALFGLFVCDSREAAA